MSDEPGDALRAARIVEQQVANLGLDDPDSMGSLVAAARIRAWHESLNAVFAVAEADIMECCLAIRRNHPSREAFGTFVGVHLAGVLTAAKAWLLADTWEIARRHRPVRELVNREPQKAIAFMREFAAAAADEQEPLPFDADDCELTDILAAPPKTRRARLRELIAASKAARDRHPDDIERIRDLEAEAAAAAQERESDRKKATRAELLQRYREVASLLGEVASEVVLDLDDGKEIAKHGREHLELSNDIAMTGVQAVTALIFTEDDDD